jgi:hypothetical protein
MLRPREANKASGRRRRALLSSEPMSRTVRVAAVGAVVLGLAVALAVTLARAEPRYAGHNSVRSPGVVTELERGDRVCQLIETVPADTAAVELVAASAGRPGPPLEVQVSRRSGERISRGRLPGGYTDGKVAVPVGELGYSVPDAAVCIRSAGRGRVQLLGVPTAPGGLEINGKPHPGLLTLAYRRAGEESAFALLPTIAHRLSLAKTTLAGGWTMWALVVLFLLSSALALRLVLTRDFGEEAG